MLLLSDRCKCGSDQFHAFWRLIYPGRERFVYHRNCGKLHHVRRARRPLQKGVDTLTERGMIYAEKPQQCDECSEIRELRPYGPGGRVVCHPCYVAHPEWIEEVDARAALLMFGTPLPEKFSAT